MNGHFACEANFQNSEFYFMNVTGITEFMSILLLFLSLFFLCSFLKNKSKYHDPCILSKTIRSFFQIEKPKYSSYTTCIMSIVFFLNVLHFYPLVHLDHRYLQILSVRQTRRERGKYLHCYKRANCNSGVLRVVWSFLVIRFPGE